MAHRSHSQNESNSQFFLAILKTLTLVSVIGLMIFLFNLQARNRRSRPKFPTKIYGTQPLVMKEGDPYIRALMRTITASEANVTQPYHVIYGGKHVSDLSRHPNRCVPILRGPNVGNCTTAAGRYQFINTTWDEKAKRYHPKVSGFLWWKSYSFEPEYQDSVVYAWLSDSKAWGVDIPKLLRQGKIEEVLRLLSGTWTSLGYGIETNSMSRHLPQIYQNMLREELGKLG
ncbi:MAG: glycoside hydrolase family protein [Xenococcaceae cyanobacterium]